MSTVRAMAIEDASRISVEVSNRASHYAAYWLELLTGQRPSHGSGATVVLRGGTPKSSRDGASAVIDLWDYQVGRDGSGVLASAVSGAAAVIGEAGGPPVALPAEMPEKWCGAQGAILALAECWRQARGASATTQYDVSAADVLRSFCLQNSGGPEEMAHSWRRNGRVCIDHGGIFPMGFFACRDGYVAILGRSRRDWKNIRVAIGDPEWAASEAFENPFAIARDSARADQLLEDTLAGFSRDELLARGLAHEAVIAPVYTQDEANGKGIFRSGFLASGVPAMPIVVDEFGSCGRSTTPVPAAPATDQPLAGLRVVELAWIWSGPMVGQILADLGAEVIKIESSTRFDLYRTRGLEAMRGKMDEAQRIESSLYFHSLNRNKRGLSLDLKSGDGRRALTELLACSQLLIDNFTVGTLDRLGFGRDAVAQINPALVQLSMSGPGRGSAVEQLRSYGLVLSALAGAEAMITSQGEFLGSPTFSISDPNAALFATMAALAGVLNARETGSGMVIDLSQIEAAATLAGTPHAADTGVRVSRSQDGRYTMADASDRAGAPVLELPETDASAPFADCSGWVPCLHPVTGSEMLVAAPWRVDGVRPPVVRPAPTLGRDNRYVLGEILGWPDGRIEKSGV